MRFEPRVSSRFRFQSSSSPKAGCYALHMVIALLLYCFNPHPARRLDATYHSSALPSAFLRFQSSSSPKAGCYYKALGYLPKDFVSILIQPEGWMLQLTCVQAQTTPLFQSSSSPKAGCYPLVMRVSGKHCVSILIQPEGWMLQGDHAGKTGWVYVSILIQPEGWMLRVTGKRLCVQPRFNPHPARRLDATEGEPPGSGKDSPFQSSSSPKAGCYSMIAFPLYPGVPVSILIQPEGWMLPFAGKKCCKALEFQSSSSPKAGCYSRRMLRTSYEHVSILIQPEGWMLRIIKQSKTTAT